MRIEKLEGDKIRVTLTSTDLIKFNIDVSRLSPDSKELHTFLFSIMETIREETGFNPYTGQVVVEATPLRDGIIILVSKLNTPQNRITREDIKKGVKIKAKTKRALNTAIFVFESFDDLCEALALARNEELLHSSLYRLESIYYFILHRANEFTRVALLMSEYASGRRNPSHLTYIKEHSDLVAKGGQLCEMAENIRLLR